MQHPGTGTTAQALKRVFESAAEEHPIAGVLLSAWTQLPQDLKIQIVRALNAEMSGTQARGDHGQIDEFDVLTDVSDRLAHRETVE